MPVRSTPLSDKNLIRQLQRPTACLAATPSGAGAPLPAAFQRRLSAGKYLISAALAITGAEWLVRSQEVVFEVDGRDVFNSGFPPRAPRSMVAQDHRWEVV